MEGTVIAIISGTIGLIALFLILTKSTGAVGVINAIGEQYTSVVKVLTAQ